MRVKPWGIRRQREFEEPRNLLPIRSHDAGEHRGRVDAAAAHEILGQRVEEAPEEAPPAEAGTLAQAAQDVGLESEANGQGGALHIVRGTPDAIDPDGVTGVPFQEDGEVRDAAG